MEFVPLLLRFQNLLLTISILLLRFFLVLALVGLGVFLVVLALVVLQQLLRAAASPTSVTAVSSY